MRYWWVSHNQTFEHEVYGGFLWSPITKTNGQRNHFYDTMEEAQPGDFVFSFARSHIQAIGIIKRRVVVTPKPDFDGAGSNWNNTGWWLAMTTNRFIHFDEHILQAFEISLKILKMQIKSSLRSVCAVGHPSSTSLTG